MSHCPRPSGIAGCCFSVSFLSTWMLILFRLVSICHSGKEAWLNLANPLQVIGSSFYFLWGSSIYLFGCTLAQVLVWTLLLPDCWRRGNSEGCSQGKAADWPWCQVSLVAQQHWAPCMLLWIVPILVSLNSVWGLCQLGTVWDDLPSSEYEQTSRPQRLGRWDGLKSIITMFVKTCMGNERLPLEQIKQGGRNTGEGRTERTRNWLCHLMSTGGTLIPFGLMKFYKNLKGNTCFYGLVGLDMLLCNLI